LVFQIVDIFQVKVTQAVWFLVVKTEL